VADADPDYRLSRNEAATEGIRRIALGRADSALDNLRQAEAQGFAKSVHEARKDLKKLRTVIRLVRSELGTDVYRRESERFGDAGRNLSAARDAEVKLATFCALRERFGDDFPAEGAERFEAALVSERDASAKQSEAGDSGALAASIEQIEVGRREIEGWPLATDGWVLIEDGLTRAYGRGRNRFAAARSEPSAENLHEWRKRVKDLWHLQRILCDAWPPVIKAAAGEAHELSDLLGDHHDLAVLGSDAEERGDLFAGPDDRDLFLDLVSLLSDELMEKAFELGERLYAEKPKAFARRYRSLWRAWRD